MTAVRVPIVCPTCGTESLQQFDVALVAAALLKGDSISLRAPCHGLKWPASQIEREQFREYLGAAV